MPNRKPSNRGSKRSPSPGISLSEQCPSIHKFELGPILGMEGDTSVVLETMGPLGERTVPFFRVHGEENHFEQTVRDHLAVNDIDVISTHDGEVLYALDWNISNDTLFEGLIEAEANLLEARGVTKTWSFELRFKSHDSLSKFQTLHRA